jgi:hypothetical protein
MTDFSCVSPIEGRFKFANGMFTSEILNITILLLALPIRARTAVDPAARVNA